MIKGIDVSKHNGKIDWKSVKKDGIDFAILRAGYGKNNIDEQIYNNIKGCETNGIRIGLYWFSYAYTEEMARNEADYVCNIADTTSLQFPVCFDFEYDSLDYAARNGVTITTELMVNLATAFLSRVEERGYYAMNYTNIDYFNKGFYELKDRFDVWLASWSSTEPSSETYGHAIWQYSNEGVVKGIDGNVDLNYSHYAHFHFHTEVTEEGKEEKDMGNTASSWATEATEWAKTNGLMTGDENGDMHYQDNITREEMVTVLYRYNQLKDKGGK